jgi:hypothetical protein
MNKTVLVVGGIAAALIVLYLLFRNSQSNPALSLQTPANPYGTATLDTSGTGEGIGSILSNAGSLFGSSMNISPLSGVSDIFSNVNAGSLSGSNDPTFDEAYD